MTIEIMNYEEKLSAPDANYFCLGVKVTANGSTAFLSGDINNYRGAEDKLAQQLGHVDVLKLGHHGYYGSNTVGYLKRLSPQIAVLTGKTGQTRQQMWNALASVNARTYITSLYAGSAGATVINMNRRISSNIGRDASLANKIVSGYSVGLNGYVYLKNGKKVVGGGFQRVGRTGYYFAWQEYGVKPDIMTCAKALGCGFPVGAFLLNAKAASSSLVPGDHGSTYGGNPLACAAVSQVIDIFEQENLTGHVRELTPYLEEQLDKLAESFPFIKARRGKGFMQGLVLEDIPVGQIISRALENQLLVISAGGNVLRLVPPLVIEKEQIDEMAEKLRDSLAGN